MRNRAPLIFAFIIILTVVSVMVAFVSIPAAAALIMGLAIVVLVFFNPFYGLILYILLVYITPQLFFPSLQKLRIMLLLAGLILLVFFIHKAFIRERVSFISTRFGLLMLILLILIPISNISNGQLVEAWDGFYSFLTVFLLFFIITNLTENFDQFRKVCWTIVFCTAALAANGLVMAFRGYDLAGNTPTLDGRIGWMEFGHFGDPNDFALAINAAFPFVLVNLFEKNVNLIKKFILLIFAIAMVAAIYYTNSRGGFVALLVVLALFAYKKWGLLKGSLIGIVFLAFAMVIAPSRMANISPYESSASGRVYAWISGLVMLKSRPIFGIGFDNFTRLHGITAHSAFIQCMTELGLVGYFVWLSLIYSSYTGLNAVDKAAPVMIQVKYAKTLLLSLVGVLVSAVFLSQAYSPVLYIIFGLSALSIRFTEPLVVQRRSLTPREILLVVGLIVASMIFFKLLAIVYV